ncbi:MAG TPA: Gfo/Idh/MocA family oxidoreductase, partial [Anaerolineae bacterium]|nr:Gfo/Idh/MocA family oxidoreductase [Anaerolineae bacterium]
MIKAAVIGVGSMGMNHARIYDALEGVVLVGVCDAHSEQANRVASRYRTRPYSDHVALLDEERPDLVSIVVPTGLHHEVALDVIDRGLHLLVEKPIADTVTNAQEIIERAQARGVQLMVGHVERFNPAVSELKRRLEDGHLGKM